MLFDRISLVEAYDALRVAEANEGIISQILFNKTAYYGTKTVVRFDSVRQLRQHIEQNFAYQQFDPNCECATCNDSIWQLLSFTVQLPDMRYVSFVNNLRGQFESAEGALLNKTTKDRLALVFRKNARLAVVKKNATCFGYIENQGKYVSPCDYITVIKNDYHDELIALYQKTKGIYGLARTEIYVDKCRDVSREKPAVWDTTTVDPCLDLAATHEIVDAQSIWEATTTLATTTEATTTLATTEATTTLATTLATTTEATTTEATTTEATTTEATTTEATTTEATTTEATTTEATTTEATTTEATTTEDPWANYFTWYITEPIPRTTNDSWQQMCSLPISRELMIEGAGNPLDSGLSNISNKVFRNPDGTLYQLPTGNSAAPNGYWVVAIRGDLYPQYIGAIAGEVDFTVPFSMTPYAGQMRLWTGNDTSGNVGAQQISGSAGAWDGVEHCPEPTTTSTTTEEPTTTEAPATEATTTEATTTEATTTEATTTEATTTEATTTEATTTEATTTEATTTEATTTEATTTEATTTEATTTEATTTEATTTEATTTEEPTTTEATTTEATTTEATTTEATTTEATTTEATTTEATTTEATTTEAPWTPLSLGPVAWIDAADTSSYTTSGSNLTSVTDKAGTYTMELNNTPTVNNTYNGLPVFTFANNNESIKSTAYRAQVSNGNHWAIGLFRYSDTNNTKDSFWSYETNQSPKRDYAVSSSASNNTWPGELDLDGLSSNRISSTIGNSLDWTGLGGLNRNQWYIVAVYFNKSGNQIGLRFDGRTNSFSPVNDYDNSLQTNQELRIMRNRSGVHLNGMMGEFMAFAELPGTGGTDMSEIEKAEGYLAHKWGHGSLPADHPYKNTPPTS